MKVRIVLALASLSLFAFGCDSAPKAPATVEAAPQAAPADPAAAATPAAATPEAAPQAKPEDEHAGCAEKAEHAAEAANVAPNVETGCADLAGVAIEHPEATEVKRADGTVATHAGAAFGEAEKVAVSALLAAPDSFAGKTVRLEGDVSAMCGHKRGWFAIASEDKSGTSVRVMTAPTFLVPEGSIGKTAEAEGVVEVVEVEKEHAKHIAGEHKLGDPAEITANVKQVVIRARGAEFR